MNWQTALVASFVFSLGCGSNTAIEQSDSGPIADADQANALVSIAIEPNSAEIISINGSRPEQDFTVVGTYEDGSTAVISSPDFSTDIVALGSIGNSSGRFVANGIIGGRTTISATDSSSPNVEAATAEVHVIIEKTEVGEGVPDDPADLFTGVPLEDASRAAEIVYPLDQVVMPQNVFPPDVQWLRGAADDIYKIVISKPSLSVTQYLVHTGSGFGNHWQIDEGSWRSIAQSDPQEDATIVVERWEQATSEVITSPPIRMHIAAAAISGTVYYWDIQRGRIVQIDDGTNVPVEFLPNPEQGCIGCHAVSSNGRYMAGRFGGGQNVGGVYDLTQDLTGESPPLLFPTTNAFQWWFASWSPDDTRLVVSDLESGGNGVLKIFDPMTGDAVATTGTLPTQVSQPAWSPDGNTIAYVSTPNNWGGQMTAGNISTVAVTGPDTFGQSQLIHNAADLNGDTPSGVSDSYPTWTPDSAKLAFGHGSSARSENGQGALYLMNPDGGDVVRLSNASGGIAAVDNFQPRFSPFQSGGYYWLSFLSRRNYGNNEVGTSGSGLQQIWVAAVKVGSTPGEDPSFVPYWLPGQRTSSRNISAYWAPRACRADGEECSVGAQCCSGDCRPDDTGALVCSPPDTNNCSQSNETCSDDDDCCESNSCTGGLCLPIVID